LVTQVGGLEETAAFFEERAQRIHDDPECCPRLIELAVM
jgi:hypothetical protein